MGHVFFANDTNIMFEVACETPGNCLVDQRSFKAYLARWLAATTQIAPFTYDQIIPRLQASARAAALSCTGGNNGTACGLKWTKGTFDGSFGVGEQMAAMEVFQSNLISRVAAPVTDSTGGTSKGDPGAGLEPPNPAAVIDMTVATVGDRAGAGILTGLLLIAMIGVQYWMVTD
jgi:mannan endo-1,6-alpha-mannosidase